MRNYKKESSHKLNEGASNRQTVSVLNPDQHPRKLRGKQWVDPKENVYNLKNKQQVKTMQDENRATMRKQADAQKAAGTFFQCGD